MKWLMLLWVICNTAVIPVVGFNCSVCETWTQYPSGGGAAVQLQTTNNCSIYALVDSDAADCDVVDEICVYRFEYMTISAGNLSHVKRQCTTYSALGITSADVTVGDCLLGSDSEALNNLTLGEIRNFGYSQANFQSYIGTYYCVFEADIGFVPTQCSDGSIATNCATTTTTTTSTANTGTTGSTMSTSTVQSGGSMPPSMDGYIMVAIFLVCGVSTAVV